jgi:hypothetical protein
VYLAPNDVSRFQCYALAFWWGGPGVSSLPAPQCAFLNISSLQPAFHITPLEYPPLALAIFSAPLLVPAPYYGLTFALMMTAIAVLIGWLLKRYQSQAAVTRFALLLVVGATPFFQLRYDLFPAACMLVCLIAAERRRWGSPTSRWLWECS